MEKIGGKNVVSGLESVGGGIPCDIGEWFVLIFIKFCYVVLF
jgi:hypothetical protein